jgi:hypothetical protein
MSRGGLSPKAGVVESPARAHRVRGLRPEAAPDRARARGTSDVTSDLHTWLPTRKWWAALLAGAFTIGAHAVGSHGWDGPEWAEFLTLLAALSTSYGAVNHDTPGGLPPKRQR